VGVILFHYKMLLLLFLIFAVLIYLFISCLIVMSADQAVLHRIIE